MLRERLAGLIVEGSRACACLGHPTFTEGQGPGGAGNTVAGPMTAYLGGGSAPVSKLIVGVTGVTMSWTCCASRASRRRGPCQEIGRNAGDWLNRSEYERSDQ